MRFESDLQKMVAQLAMLSNYVTTVTTGTNGIKPFRLYLPEEVCDFLRLKDKASVYNIPETELPRQRIGPNRGSIRYYGLHILQYVQGLEPSDIAAMMRGN